ncbi:MAG: hypothetical protein JWM91_170 [Rhodospirillales bacterium]|nr:hypothetical protein [Rhodospirillales bacterium]
MPLVFPGIGRYALTQFRAGFALTLISALALSACAVHPMPVSGPEISATLADHTAMLPGGFMEYYAPDGKLHGISDGQPYEGTWEVRNDMFCTALDGDPAVCSQVGRDGDTLYWSLDGEKKISRVSTILRGNPKNLK